MSKRTRNQIKITEISDDEEENRSKFQVIQVEDTIPNSNIDQLIIGDNNNNNNDSSGNSIQEENEYALKYLQFKEIQLDNIKLEELKKQAKQLGISVSGKKIEVYSRIESHLLFKRDIGKIQIEKEVNSFKKEQPKLLILDGISQNELLFWRVFRSKPTFKKIFSNFQTSESNNYDQLYSVYIIMKHFSNGLEIIKDKIKSNSFLSFRELNQKNQNYVTFLRNSYLNSFNLICDEIKQDTKENRELISSLLQNYHNSIHFYQMLESSIECSNIFLLNLLKQLEPIHNKSTLNREFLINTFIINSYQKVKMVIYLKSKGYNYLSGNISLSPDLDFSTLKLKQLIKTLSILVKSNSCNISRSLLGEALDKLKLDSKFTNEQLNSTLKELLEPLSSIINSKSNSNIIDKLEIEKFKYLNKNQLSVLSKEELVDSLDFFKNFYHNENLKTQILQFCEIYFSFLPPNLYGSKEMPIDYYIYFKTKKELYEKKFYYSKALGDLFNLLDLDTQKDMIDSINFHLIKDKVICAIKSNNLQLIDYTLKSIEVQTSIEIKNIIIESIESKQVLDYLFKNYNSIFFKSINNNFWMCISSLELLEHYEHLMKSINSTFKIQNIKTDLDNLRGVYINYGRLSTKEKWILNFKKIIRALNNPSLYILDQKKQQKQQKLRHQLQIQQQNQLSLQQRLQDLQRRQHKQQFTIQTQLNNLEVEIQHILSKLESKLSEKLDFEYYSYIYYSLINFQPELIIELIRTERFKIMNAAILFTVFNYPSCIGDHSYQSFRKIIHLPGSLNTISKWLLNRCINYPNYLQENEHGVYELSIKIDHQDIQVVCKNKTTLIQLLYHAGHYDDIFLISNLESKDFVPLFSSTGEFVVNRISLKFADKLFKYIFENNIETLELIHSIYHQIIQSNNVPLLKLIDSKYLKALIGGNQYKRPIKNKKDYLINDSDIQKFLEKAQQLDHCEIFIIISNYKPGTKRKKNLYESQSYSLINNYLNQ